MDRISTKNGTGVAPDGRFYPGDWNALQDVVAALTDLTQQLSVGTLAIGESGLQLLRYAAGEARVTGSLRADGVVRALSGLVAGTYTTVGRDAIVSPPYGLVILNVNTNRYEFNGGTADTPNWQSMAGGPVEVPIGVPLDWPWAAASIPSWARLPYGQPLVKLDFPQLDVIANAAAYVYGSDSTHFNLPDMRGLVTVGKDDMGGTPASRITVAVSGTDGTSLGAIFGAEGISLTTAQLPAHNHAMTGVPSIATSVNWIGGGSNTRTGISYVETFTGSHDIGTMPITVGIGTLATSNTGSGSAHRNVQPSIIVNKMMRVI